MSESRMVGSSRLTGSVLGLLGWAAALLMFFPVFWMVLTAFKQERDAFTSPPKFIFEPTLDQFDAVLSGGLETALLNSLWATVGSTVLVVVLALPAAYALSIRPVEKWTDVLFFFLSTRMLPVVGAIVPIYIIARDIGMLDNIWTLVDALHGDEPADRGLDAALVHERGADRGAGGGARRRRQPVGRRRARCCSR